MSIFDKRENIQPYEYPHLLDFMRAIHQSFWLPEHFTYDRDAQEYLVKLNDVERDVVKKAMLAIGMIENKVKTFWGHLDMRLPKPEIASVGFSFSNSEVIHQHTQQRLLEVLGLEKEFETLNEIPCMKGRAEYLSKYLEGMHSHSDKEFTKSLILFTLLIENASLFSQFVTLASFKKYKNILTNFSSVIGAISREEDLHARFGEEIIKIIREENPEWFDYEMEAKIRRNVQKAYTAELEVIEWMFEKGELEFLSKAEIIEYLKLRFNNSLSRIGYEPEFEVNQELLKKTEFFEVQLKATASFDFFNEKSSDYSNNFDKDSMW